MITIKEFLVKKHQQSSYDDYVDLDLPSGTFWVSCNLGAKQPEEDGDYFAWGETETKKKYKWSTYKFGDADKLTKYTKKDRKKKLEPEDDAATVKLGKEYSIPTQEQWQELYDNCNWEWTKQNGKTGYKVISKTHTSKFIFLPAAGVFDGSSVANSGSGGYYWSATLDSSEYFYAYYCGFYSSNVEPAYSNHRNAGYTIRPVHNSRNK